MQPVSKLHFSNINSETHLMTFSNSLKPTGMQYPMLIDHKDTMCVMKINCVRNSNTIRTHTKERPVNLKHLENSSDIIIVLK